jgi:hypothetical protein
VGDKLDTTRAALLPLAAAAALHVALVLVLGHWRGPSLWENGAIADALVAGHGFAVPTAGGGYEPTSWQAPAYPLLLAGLWTLLGKGPTAHLALSLLQALLTASVVVPLGALATRWSGPAAGAAARWLAALLPLHAWYSTRLHHTALDLALAPWVLLAIVRLRDDPRPRDVVLAGASLAALGLVQPVLLAALGAFALLLAASDRRRGRATALTLGVCVALLAPWTVRNAFVHGRLVPIKDSLGKELWIGNNPQATGTAYLPGGLVPVEETHPAPPGPEAERFAAMGAAARGWIAAEPGAFAALTARRLLWLWSWPPADLVRHGLGGEAVVYRWGHVAAWLGLVGLALLGARGPHPEQLLALVALFGVASLVYGVTHVGQARFRGEVEFVLVPLAAAGLLRLRPSAAPSAAAGPAPASPSPGAS